MSRTFPARRPLTLEPAVAPALGWKRLLDLVLGTIALVCALPVILCLALAVVVDSPGPAFFGQERVGREGRRFRMWKLRSMRAGCDQAAHRRAAARWFAGRPTSDGYKSLDDARITRLGRILRRTNLDELPQLFNVVKGDMSLVGPRPAIPYELDHYRGADFRRLTVPPGLTGLWQVSRRDRLSAAEMIDLDLRYVRQASPWLDLRILFMTVPAVFASARRGV
jgi:lipopolysaccharide/colanic/teichoic acid biosynthesis glycosyltransferase